MVEKMKGVRIGRGYLRNWGWKPTWWGGVVRFDLIPRVPPSEWQFHMQLTDICTKDDQIVGTKYSIDTNLWFSSSLVDFIRHLRPAFGCALLPRHLYQGVFFRKAFYSLKRSFWFTLLSFYNFNLLAFLPPRPPPFPSSLLSRHSVLPRIGWLVLVTFSIMVMDNAPHTLLVTRYWSWVVTGWRQRRALRRG